MKPNFDSANMGWVTRTTDSNCPPDVGVLSVLDPRLRTKAYGRVFLESLPNYKITSKIEDLSEIFAQQKAV